MYHITKARRNRLGYIRPTGSKMECTTGSLMSFRKSIQFRELASPYSISLIQVRSTHPEGRRIR